MKKKPTFACAINCMDGRVQDAVEEYMKATYGVDYVDMITEPSPNKILAEQTNVFIVEDIRKRLEISVQLHGAKQVAIVGHAKCAGNPADEAQQILHLNDAKKAVEAFGFNAEVILLWVYEDHLDSSGDGWYAERIFPAKEKVPVRE
jgi:carbonic anhydrase